MPFTRSTRSTSAQTPASDQTFSVSGQGLGNTSHLSSLPINRKPYYTISLTNDNRMYYTSDSWSSTSYEHVFAEYQRLVDSGVDKVFQISIVESYAKVTYGGVVDDAPAATSGFVPASQTNSPEINLVGYTFSRYGKGYLMKPTSESVYLGNKYFLGGWWNEATGGWFFRRDCVRTLYELGAVFDGPKRYDPTREFWHTETSGDTTSTVSLTGRFYRNYGRGLILFPTSMEDPLYGQKYLLDGWWMNTRDGPGWFFRTQFEDTLVAHGARRTNLLTRNTHVRFSDDEEEDLDVLLREVQGDDEDDVSDPDYTPDHREEHEYIQEEYIEDPVASDAGPDSEDENDSDLSDMIFIRYGKGYVLKPHKVDPRYSAKYFLGGWWNAKAKGWFFKREMKKFLKAQGATYLKIRN